MLAFISSMNIIWDMLVHLTMISCTYTCLLYIYTYLVKAHLYNPYAYCIYYITIQSFNELSNFGSSSGGIS